MRIAIPLTFLLAGAVWSAGCSPGDARQPGRGGSAAGEPAAPTDESAAPRDLEERAATYQERFRGIQESDASAEEKALAVSRLADEQQRAVRDAADGTAAEEPDDRASEPPQ